MSGVFDMNKINRGVKPKADSTLHNMSKDELIDYIRCLEHNYNTAVWFNENQARYIESLEVVDYKTLEAWLYQIALNNVGVKFDGDFSNACEEIISRLDGLKVFAKEGKPNG